MSRKHHVRQHHWISGILNTIDHYFDSAFEAISHANSSDAQTVKVYDPDGQLIHITTSLDTRDSYASPADDSYASPSYA